MSNVPDKPSQFQIDEMYKQVKINTRQKALDYMFVLVGMGGAGTSVPVSQIVQGAMQIEEYILTDIDVPQEKPKPTIVPAQEVPKAPRDYRK